MYIFILIFVESPVISTFEMLATPVGGCSEQPSATSVSHPHGRCNQSPREGVQRARATDPQSQSAKARVRAS